MGVMYGKTTNEMRIDLLLRQHLDLKEVYFKDRLVHDAIQHFLHGMGGLEDSLIEAIVALHKAAEAVRHDVVRLSDAGARLQARVAELEHWPDGTRMTERSATAWRSRCLAAEHKNEQILFELGQLRLRLMELPDSPASAIVPSRET